MSHYSVGVITKENDPYGELNVLLAPYDEELEALHYITRDELIQKEKEFVETYQNGLYTEFLKDPEGYKEKHPNPEHIDFLENDFPKLMQATDEELYQHAIKYKREEDLAEDGSVISRYNPNAKWDWYVIGGRWNGAIHTKDGKDVNTARIKDIDFSPDEKVLAEARHFWDVYVDQTVKDDEVTSFYKRSYYTDLFANKEEYAQYQARFYTYALLTYKGEWFEPGQMGWFGMSDETLDQKKEYIKKFDQLMDKYADYYLTVVDCHI